MKLLNHNLEHIDTLIFDFGGVLLDIDVMIAIREFEKLGLTTINTQDIHPHNSGVFLDLELGTISTEDFVRRIKEATSINITTEQVLGAWNSLLLEYDPRRFEVLEKLRSNHTIMLLSNTNLPHRERFIEIFNNLPYSQNNGKKFEDYFDRVFYSDIMHMRKPDSVIYERVIAETGIDPKRTLFIDDNLINVEGAQSVGLNAHHLKAPSTILDLFD